MLLGPDHHDAPTPVRPNLKEKQMTDVHFLKINCRDTQETFSDEPYLRVNGELIAGPWGSFDEGETRNIDVSRNFTGQRLVELFESDSDSGDDFIAAFTIFDSEVGQGVTPGALRGNGGSYTLFYEVTA